MKGSATVTRKARHSSCMPIHDLKDQIARLPEQPGVYLYANAAGETIYVGKARSLRDRVRSYLGRLRHAAPRPTRCSTRPTGSRYRHRLGGRGAGAREQPDQAAVAEVQHPAARRQELPLPAADDRRGVSARAGGPAGRARRQRLRRPVPAGLARAPDDGADAPAVRHPVVQRGDHRQARPARASSTTSSAASRRASTRSARRSAYAVAVADTRLFLEGQQRRAGRPTSTRRCSEAAAAERFEEAAHLRDAMRTVQTLRDRQQKMATARLGDRDAFGAARSGRPGAVVQVFLMRGGRVLERVELAAERRRGAGARRGRGARRPRVQQFYEDRPARRPRCTCRARPRTPTLLEAWLSARAGRRVQVRRAAARRQARPGRSGVAQRARWPTRPGSSTPALAQLRRARDAASGAGAAGDAAAHRLLRHLDHPGQRDGRLDGGLRGRPDAARASTGSSASVDGGRSRSATGRSRRLRGDERGRARAVRARARAGRAVSRPDRDRRRQGAAVGGLRGAARRSGLANLVAVGLAKKEELVFTRDRDEPIALAERRPGAAAAAADPRRGAPLRRDVPPAGAHACATCARSSTACRASARAAEGAADARSAASPASGARRAKS